MITSQSRLFSYGKGLFLRRFIREIRRLYASLRFCNSTGYNEHSYWEACHRRYNSDIRTVGSGPEDIRIDRYPKQKKEFLEFLGGLGIPIEGAVCVEFGCGNGYWGKTVLEEKARQYVGIDISATALKNSKKSVPTGTFKCMNLGEEDYNLETRGGLVFSIDVIQHIVNDRKLEKFLGNMARAANSGGFIVLTSYAGFGDTPSHSQGKTALLKFFNLPELNLVYLWDIPTIQKHLRECRLMGTSKFWDKTILAFQKS